MAAAMARSMPLTTTSGAPVSETQSPPVVTAGSRIQFQNRARARWSSSCPPGSRSPAASTGLLPAPGGNPVSDGLVLRGRRFDDLGDFFGRHAALDHVALELEFRAPPMNRVDCIGDDAGQPQHNTRPGADPDDQD